MDSERDSKGHFGAGNQIATGHKNPLARRAQEYKQAVIEAVSKSDIKAIIDCLKAKALQGDIQAAREILDRTIGRDSGAELNQGRPGVEIRIIEDKSEPAPKPVNNLMEKILK